MTIEILKTYAEVSLLVDEVQSLADSNREIFGFLPRSAYTDLAKRNQLWVARDAQSRLINGYLLFGSSNTHLRIAQLYVDERCRAQGVGRLLIDQLKVLAHSERHQLISARVAAELSANAFWEKRGLKIIRQVSGGMTTGRLINIRAYEIRGASLWEQTLESALVTTPQPFIQRPLLSIPNFAIDLNLLFDVVKDRNHAQLVGRMISDALSNEIRLCVTAEFSKELERTSLNQGLDPVLQLAKLLPTLPVVPKEAIAHLVEPIRSLVFPEADRDLRRQANDDSDIFHIASCIHHRVTGFITRDGAMLRARQLLFSKYQIEVMSPADLIVGFEAPDEFTFKTHVLIGARSVTISLMEEVERKEIADFLEDNSVEKNSIVRILDPGTSQLPRARIVFRSGAEVAALASYLLSANRSNEIVIYLVIDESQGITNRIVDHILEVTLGSLPRNRICEIRLMTGVRQVQTRETIFRFKFEVCREQASTDLLGSVRYGFNGVVTKGNWSEFALEIEGLTGNQLSQRFPTHMELMNTGLVFKDKQSNIKKAIPLFEFETAFSPVLILGEGRESVITPIRETYANELIKSAARQAPMFGKEAPLHYERAYFGRAGLEKIFSRGAIVLFYISGKRKELVGFARVTAAGKYSPEAAEMAFARQGVLGLDELTELANDSGEIGVFTFDGYRNLKNSIEIRKLRERGFVDGANMITSQRLSYAKLVTVLDEDEMRV